MKKNAQIKHNFLDNELINSLGILSSAPNVQKDYLMKIHQGSEFNLDELMLEFDDSKYIWEIYPELIKKNLIGIELILDEIDKMKLHELDDLNHQLWKDVKKSAKNILELIQFKYES